MSRPHRQLQQQNPDPPQPLYILRGHLAQIHAIQFIADNLRLVTADADGWVVLWDVATRRPVAVWKAHENAVLAVSEWIEHGKAHGRRIITHGRDNKIYAWKVGPEEEAELDTELPVETTAGHRRMPWLAASLDVNALNFCAFAMCERIVEESYEGYPPLLIAVPAPLDSQSVDIMELPSGSRVHASIKHGEINTGMAMALVLTYIDGDLALVAGYESGHAIVYRHQHGSWNTLYANNPHSQPILSLSLPPSSLQPSYFLTTSADALIVKHPIPTVPSPGVGPSKVIDTKHSGQQSIAIRSDGKIFGTAGWDSRIRIYSAKTMKELAVLKWHREGCYAVAFGEVAGGQEKHGTELMTVGESRNERVKATHWVAGGAKDGKVSLWEVY